MTTFSTRYAVFDRFQQRHRWLGFPLAVLQKYADDQGGYLAATITYYGFFSVFPLLLVLTTVLGFVLQSHPHLEQSIVDSALGQFPVIGPQLKRRLAARKRTRASASASPPRCGPGWASSSPPRTR